MSKAGNLAYRYLVMGDLIVLFFVSQACCLQYAQSELTAISIIGKPTSQSTSSSHAAVDGSLTTYIHTAAHNDPHPWWQVDLGNDHCLGNIIVYLRQDCCGVRFAAAVVRAGLRPNYAENQPCGLPATREQSSQGAVIEFLCMEPRRARYVSVDIDISSPDVTNAILQIAEVEVEEYASVRCDFGHNLAYFKTLHTGSLIGNSDPVSTMVARYLTQCALHCIHDAGCFSFDFAPGNGQCHLHSLNSTAIVATPSDDFSVYVLWN